MADQFTVRQFSHQPKGEAPPNSPVPSPTRNLVEAAARGKVPLLTPRKLPTNMDEARQKATQMQNAVRTRAATAHGRPTGMSGTPSAGPSGVSPLSQSLAKAKAAMQTAMLGNYDLGDLNDKLSDLASDPNIDLATYKGILGEAVKRAQNTPEHIVPGGSVDIGRGNGPNAISQQELEAGEARQSAGLRPGETLTPFGDKQGYHVQLPDRDVKPLPDGKKPVAAPTDKETPFQRQSVENERQRYEQDTEKYREEKKKYDEAGDSEKPGLIDATTRAAHQMAVDESEIEQSTRALPGGPDAPQAPAADSAPAPAPQAIGSITPQGGTQQQPFAGQQNAPQPAPKNPQTGLPVAATSDHYESVMPGALYHGPDGKMYRKALAQAQTTPIDGSNITGQQGGL